MKNHPVHSKISMLGLGTTGFWSGHNTGLSDCIHEAVERYGIRVIDTSEMYGDGRSETALGKTISSLNREDLFIVDKITPDHMTEDGFQKSLDGSLQRLQTDYIDLYLLHWRENADLSLLVGKMEGAVKSGKIRHWGVSNFDIPDLQDLLEIPGGEHCFCNQVFYCIYERGAGYGLLPFMNEHGILPMSYSSLGSDYVSHPDIHKNERVMRFCKKTGFQPEAMMLKLNVETGFCSLFGTSSLLHLRDNLKKIPDEVYLEFKDIIDKEFPEPDHLYPLVKI